MSERASHPPTGTPSGRPFGVVLAGGESRRYGAPKALATVGGARIVDRVVAALRSVVPEVIISANEPGLFQDLALPTLPDAKPDLGPLAGIYTALLHARDAGRPGILAVACDMPFPCVGLLQQLASRAFGDGDGDPGPAHDFGGRDAAAEAALGSFPDVAIPQSRGRRGVEPLFAAYRTTCLPAIEAALDAGERRMIGFHARVRVRRIPLAVVESLCDPERAFLNVNTPEDRDRAERMAHSEHGTKGDA